MPISNGLTGGLNADHLLGGKKGMKPKAKAKPKPKAKKPAPKKKKGGISSHMLDGGRNAHELSGGGDHELEGGGDHELEGGASLHPTDSQIIANHLLGSGMSAGSILHTIADIAQIVLPALAGKAKKPAPKKPKAKTTKKKTMRGGFSSDLFQME